MSAWQSARVALRALTISPLRSLLTILGIVIGVAAVITMIALGSAARAEIEDQIRSLGSNLLIVIPGVGRDGGARLESGSRPTLTERDAAAIMREVPLVAEVAPVVWGQAQVVQGNRNWAGAVFGTGAGVFVARDWPLVRGQPFTPRDVSTSAKVAVLGASAAEQLFGAVDPVGRTVRIGSVPVTVIGVLAAKGPQADGRDQDGRIYLPISTAKARLLGGAHETRRDAVDHVWVKVRSSEALAPAIRQIRALLRQRHRLPRGAEDDFWIRDPAAAMSAQFETTRTMTVLLASVASVSLLVGGISIMNIMLVSVTERTREIGLRLAVGARRRDILGQFLVESVTLCGIGGVIGVLLGVGVAVGLSAVAGWPVLVGPGSIALAIGFAAAVGIFFGFYPAHKASRLDPIEALRFE
ncbi:MAG: ABC transporter permease [Gammaproteobacteria bacterium]